MPQWAACPDFRVIPPLVAEGSGGQAGLFRADLTYPEV